MANGLKSLTIAVIEDPRRLIAMQNAVRKAFGIEEFEDMTLDQMLDVYNSQVRFDYRKRVY